MSNLEELLLDEKQLKQKQEEYCAKLRQQVLSLRRSILMHLKQKHAMSFDQAFIRKLSQHFTAMEYKLPSSLGKPPFAIGSSHQDAMHHTHWLQAALLLHELDELPMTLQQAGPVMNICSENPDEASRLEEQLKVYYNLASIITGKASEASPTHCTTRVTNEMIYQLLQQTYRAVKALLAR